MREVFSLLFCLGLKVIAVYIALTFRSLCFDAGISQLVTFRFWSYFFLSANHVLKVIAIIKNMTFHSVLL